MPFKVELAQDSDIPKIITILFKAYGTTNAYINAVFPRGNTEQGHRLAVERMIFIKSIVSGVWWDKVIDEETGEIVGGAMWNLCEEAKPPAYEMDGPPGTWETDVDKKYAQALQRSFAEDEGALWEENDLPLLGLSIMVISPEFQRRGAGAALLQAGLKIADGLHAATILVSNDAGRPLYERFGFVTKKERDLAVDEEVGPSPEIRVWTMIRERKHE